MKFSILILLVFYISFNATAQQQRFVVPLKEEMLLTIKNNTGERANSVLEIIDLTGDSVLGYIPAADINNDRVAIYPPLPKQEWLTTLASAGSIINLLNTSTSLLLVVSDISVGGTEQNSYVGLRGRLYASLAGKEAYALVKSIDDVYVNNTSGLKESGNNMINLLQSIFSQSLAGLIINQKDLKSKTDLIKEERERLSFVSSGVFPSGIYMNYQELKSLKPSFGQFFIKTDISKKEVQVNSFTLNDSTLRPVEEAYAIAVGNELYLYKNKRLYAVESRGNNFIFSKYIDPKHRKNNATFWSNNVGSKFKELEDNNPFDNRNVIQIDNYRGKGIRGEAIKINIENGAIEL